jgi:transcriptional regulator with XRE-family HTH domain
MAAKKKSTRRSAGAVDAGAFLEKLTGGPLTIGRAIRSIRLGEEASLDTFAKKLGISRARLCDIEKGRRGVSAARAAEWARALGRAEALFVALALQADLDAAGIKLTVRLEAGRRAA